MSMKIKVPEFDVAKISFSMKVDKDTKRKIFYVNHNKSSILIQTPKMYFPNGIKHWQSSAFPETYELELSFGEDKENANNNKLIQEFQTKMSQLDDLIKGEIFKNPKDWIGKPKVTMDTIETSCYPNPIVRVPKDKDTGETLDYPNRMRLKLERESERGTDGNNVFSGHFSSSRRNKTRVMIFDENSAQLDLNELNCEEIIPRGSKGIVLIELVNISVVGDKVYPKWKLVQGKVFRSNKSITENIIDDDDIEGDETVDTETIQEDLDSIEETVEQEDEPEHSSNKDVEQEESEEEVTPEPVITKAKPKGRRAAVAA